MSNNHFTLLLVLVCVALIAILVLINRFQERRSKDRLHRQRSAMEALESASATVQTPVETILEVPYEAPEADRDVDELTETAIVVRFGQRVLGSDLIALIRQHLKLKSKPVRFLGGLADQLPSAPLQVMKEYDMLQIVVTLANTNGALNMEEWSRLHGLADQLALAFDGEITHDSLDEIKIKANNAYQLYRDHQENITLFWIMSMPLPLSTLDKVLRQHGFENQGRGDELKSVWYRKNTFGTDYQKCRVLERSQQGEVTQVVFEQLLALTLETKRPFTDLMNTQRSLMAPLNMQVVDAEGQPILPEMEAMIDEDIQAFYAQMRDDGLWAGGYRVSRLFS